MLEGDWDTCVQMAREQVKEGAHVLDVCVDYVGRDGTIDMEEIASRFATQAALPLVFDSTEPWVIEAGLQHSGGKALLNSANLEDGEAEGSRLDRMMSLAHEYGAGVICLAIDEEGQARDADWKLRVCKRIYDIAIERYGIDPTDLIFDMLTFPLGSGQEDLRKDGMETIEAIRRVKAELPGSSTILGLSNVSFGLNPAIRHVLNSVFLHECREAGLDAAIVHAARIMPMHKIDDKARELALDLIYDRRRDGYDPLTELMAHFDGVEVGTVEREDRSGWPVEDRLKQRIIDGEREGLTDELDEALTGGRKALSIINDVLLEGMKVVGDLFGRGEMQLPFVLQSAETMKAAVAFLEPHMEKADAGGKGVFVIGTVKGDVHDIGKNLVDIILTNNGYEVHNIGIKQPLQAFVDKAKEVEADAIGMSGLLVKSTIIMRENLQELNNLGLAGTPVMLGGAALTRNYVEVDLRKVYEGRLFYGKDAFEGLHTMDTLISGMKSGDLDPEFGRAEGGRKLPPRKSQLEADEAAAKIVVPARSDVAIDVPLFTPPFVGARVAKGISLDEIAAYINETALFRNQWQFRPQGGESDEEFKAGIRPQLRAALDEAKAEGWLVPAVAWGYFPVNSDGDDLVVWKDDDRREERLRFHFPRQQKDRVPLHLGLLPAGRQRGPRLRRVPRDDRRRAGQRARAGAVRGEQVRGVPVHARSLGRDDRSARRAVAPPHPRGVGLRRRGRPVARRPVPPAVPRLAVLVGLPRVPGPRGPGEARRAAHPRQDRREAHRGVPARARAEHLGDHRPPPRGQVLHRVTSRLRASTCSSRSEADAGPELALRGEEGAGDDVGAERGEDREVEQAGRGHHRGVVLLAQREPRHADEHDRGERGHDPHPAEQPAVAVVDGAEQHAEHPGRQAAARSPRTARRQRHSVTSSWSGVAREAGLHEVPVAEEHRVGDRTEEHRADEQPDDRGEPVRAAGDRGEAEAARRDPSAGATTSRPVRRAVVRGSRRT